MRSYNPDQIEVRFDDERLVADAGLLLPATLAVGLGPFSFCRIGERPRSGERPRRFAAAGTTAAAARAR